MECEESQAPSDEFGWCLLNALSEKISSRFRDHMTELEPVGHIGFAVAVNVEGLTVAGDRLQTTGVGLAKFADIGETGRFIDEDANVSIANRAPGDQQHIIEMVDRMKVIARDTQSTIDSISITFAVRGNVYFLDRAGV